MMTIENEEPTSRPAKQSRFLVRLAQTQKEVREVQELRFRVFREELGVTVSRRVAGIDQDLFDPHCDHLLVRDGHTRRVIGTYRILPAHQADKVGAFYAETEFDISRIRPLASRLVEVGRACVHPDFRQGAVIALLWAGLAKYLARGGYDHVMGCASLSMKDGGRHAAAIYHYLKEHYLSPEKWRVFPLHPLRPIPVSVANDPALPPLVKGYVRLGAYICGEPAWDPFFNTADLLMLLPVAEINRRYAHHFFGKTCATASSAS